MLIEVERGQTGRPNNQIKMSRAGGRGGPKIETRHHGHRFSQHHGTCLSILHGTTSPVFSFSTAPRPLISYTASHNKYILLDFFISYRHHSHLSCHLGSASSSMTPRRHGSSRHHGGTARRQRCSSRQWRRRLLHSAS
jgi:hypothetical protein